jgi:hypothetical protein
MYLYSILRNLTLLTGYTTALLVINSYFFELRLPTSALLQQSNNNFPESFKSCRPISYVSGPKYRYIILFQFLLNLLCN